MSSVLSFPLTQALVHDPGAVGDIDNLSWQLSKVKQPSTSPAVYGLQLVLSYLCSIQLPV